MIARRLLLLAGAALPLVAGCQKNVTDPLPVEVGFQPLEPVTDAAWPEGQAGDPYPETLGTVVYGSTPDHDFAHARGYVHAPLVSVYQALHDPAAGRIHNPSGEWHPTVGVEPEFPISYRIRYVEEPLPTLIVEWDVTYRGGPLEGTDAAPAVVGFRFQKTWGNDHIRVQAGSIVATEVDVGVTSVEMVGWLDADTQGPSDVAGTVRDLYGNLLGVLAAPP
jgi:hypothetical protein